MAAKQPPRANYGALKGNKYEPPLRSYGVSVLEVMSNGSSADCKGDTFFFKYLRYGLPAVTRSRSWLVAIACLCVTAFVAVVVNVRPGSTLPSSSGANEAATTETHTKLHEPSEVVTNLARSHGVEGEFPVEEPPLAFTALNFYHIRDGKPAQDYPWLKDVKLVEPHRETTLRVVNAREGLFDYRWEVRVPGDGSRSGSVGELEATAIGAEAAVVFTRLEDNVVVLEELNAAGDVTRRLEETVMVKYVRREIRTLTDDDREELLDAMFTLWDVRGDEGEGKKLYGPDYTDVWAIVSFHFAASADFECDHLHDGLGFLTSHTLVSNTFEHNLQLVNPKVTLPYWDFTIESSMEFMAQEGVGDEEPQLWSPMMKESWFGGSDSKDYQVKNGRWAYMEVPKMEQSGAGDVFGRLRAPWVFNARPYLTRGLGVVCGARSEPFFPWPTCKMHYDLTMSHSEFYGWVWDAQYDPHGTVHTWLGGVLDCDEAYDRVKDLVGDDTATKLATLSFIHRKNMYREGFFRCTTKDVDGKREGAVEDNFTCGCLDYDLEQGGDYQTVMKGMVYVGDLLEDFDESTKREVVDNICRARITDGDHLQSSSPMDPTFWPVHPTMERLWMFKVLTGSMTDLTWPDHDTITTTPGGVTRKNVVSISSDRCAGHRGSDVFPFVMEDASGKKSNVFRDVAVRSGIRSTEVGGGGRDDGFTLTNREVLQALDPRSNNLPYVYDTFRWDHCEAEGYKFEDAWHPALTSAAVSAASHIDYSSGNVPTFIQHEDDMTNSSPSPRRSARHHSGSPK